MAESQLYEVRVAYREAIRADHEFKRLVDRIASIERTEQVVLATVDRLRQALAVEEAEAERWDGQGFTQVLLALVGRLDDRRSMERAHAERAAIDLASAERRRQALADQLADLRSQRVEMRAVALQIGPRLEALRDALGEADPEGLERLTLLEQQCAGHERLANELRECVQAAGRALTSIMSASADFDSAAKWGTWDLLGGGFVTSALKHGKVEAGLDGVDQAHRDLARLVDELDDVRHILQTSVPTGLELGSGAWIWDVWFDNIFSDLKMQARIDEMGDRLSVLEHHVRRVLVEAETRYNDVSADFTRCRGELSTLLLG
jgi:hypothetical protein